MWNIKDVVSPAKAGAQGHLLDSSMGYTGATSNYPSLAPGFPLSRERRQNFNSLK
jgi:hypothetical protein